MGEDEPQFAANLDVIREHQLYDYLQEHVLLPVLYAESRHGYKQVAVAEQDETLTFLDQTQSDFRGNYNVERQLRFGTVLRERAWGFGYTPVIGSRLTEAQKGDRLILIREYGDKRQLRTGALTEVRLGVQYQHSRYSEKERQAMRELLGPGPAT